MPILGLSLALLSGICNGFFTAPMKIIRNWKWENLWLIFILVSCLVLPQAVVRLTAGNPGPLIAAAPAAAVRSALLFGFAFGFGAIMFGLSVDRLGISLANSLVIGLSSAFGSIVPLLLSGTLRLDTRQTVLLLGVAAFLAGVWLCGKAGSLREGSRRTASAHILTGYLLAIGSGLLNAVLNIGFALAQPIAQTASQSGQSAFYGTSVIWMLMLGAASLPNIAYCLYLCREHRSFRLFAASGSARSGALSVLMGMLWGGAILIYGAATPLLGQLGPSVGWPLSLSVALLSANLMGFLLGEWRGAPSRALGYMRFGIATLIGAALLCVASTVVTPA